MAKRELINLQFPVLRNKDGGFVFQLNRSPQPITQAIFEQTETLSTLYTWPVLVAHQWVEYHHDGTAYLSARGFESLYDELCHFCKDNHRAIA
ncbi:MAG: hypothetical protein CMM93_08845 [Rickettsiales bacterium]|mgnify:CR=1 FL=1|nr:hypothetical protein [Rickettsiales bacterium]|tara:strand:+ start:105 stop:383 length:279 start_codon:yes stop_codon:yes gene_type:complete